MIYLARIVFLLGSSTSTLCLFVFAAKLAYEPVLPEAMQGQYLGNDLLGGANQYE